MCQLMSNISHIFVLRIIFSITYFGIFTSFFFLTAWQDESAPSPRRKTRAISGMGGVKLWEELNYVTVDSLPIFTS